MKYAYPLNYYETKTYSSKIKDYTKLTTNDKAILLNDFKEYYKYCFWWLKLPCPTLDQLYMAKYIGRIAYKRCKKMLQAQRGLAKSLTTQILVTWLLLRNRREIICVISATASRAKSFVAFVGKMFKTIPLLHSLAPKGRDRDNTEKLDVAGKPINDSASLSAFGVTSAKTGSRATFLIYDDVEIPENSDTPDKREKIKRGVAECGNLGIANSYSELCICTPQSSDTVYNNEIFAPFEKTIIPAQYPKKIEVYNGNLAKHIRRALQRNPKLVGLATDKRNNLEHLVVQMTKGMASYTLQYMLDTSLSDVEKYPLKLRDLIVMDLDPREAPISIVHSNLKHNLLPINHNGFAGDGYYSPASVSPNTKKYENVIMAIDPSGRGKDETAYAIVAHLAGRIFVLDFGGLTGGYEESTLVQLARIALAYEVTLIKAESNFGDGMFVRLLQPILKREYITKNGAGCKVEEFTSTKNKELRILENLEPLMMTNRLVVSKQAILKDSKKESTKYTMSYQLSHLCKIPNCLPNDDIIDVIDMGASHFVEVVSRDLVVETRKILNKIEQMAEDRQKFGNNISINKNTINNHKNGVAIAVNVSNTRVNYKKNLLNK